MGIENGEMNRPNHLTQINPDCDQSVLDPPAHRPGTGRCQRLLLGKDGGDGCRDNKGEERQLFQNQPAHGSGRASPRINSRFGNHRKPSQRPVIQKQKQKRQRHQHRLREQTEGKASRQNQVSINAWLPHITNIGEQSEKKENSAEHVFALGNPDDRLCPQRMYRKERRDKGAPPGRARHLPEGKEKEKNANRVQEHIDEMITAGVKTKDLRVEHERDRSQRVPVTDQRMREGPLQSLPCEAVTDRGILVNVGTVVVVDEVKAEGLTKDDPGNRNQAKTDDGCRPAFC